MYRTTRLPFVVHLQEVEETAELFVAVLLIETSFVVVDDVAAYHHEFAAEVPKEAVGNYLGLAGAVVVAETVLKL